MPYIALIRRVRRRLVHASGALVCLAVLAGCDGSTGPTLVPDELEISLEAVTFDALDDTVTIQVEVRDQFGDPLEAADVQFESDDASVASVNTNGLVRATGAGSTSIEVRSGEAQAWVSVQVEQTPDSAELTDTVPSEAPAGSSLEGFGVRVRDANGHPIAGLAVEFVAHSGSLEGEASQLRSTGVDGVASFAWSIPQLAGESAMLEVRPAGLEPIQVALTVVPAAPDTLLLVSGGEQSGLRGEALANPIRVRLTDAFDNPIPDRAVEVEVESGGGTLSASTTHTDVDGELAVEWTLGSEIGTQSGVIRIAGRELRVTARAVAEPDEIVLVSGGGQQAHRTLTLADPIVVRVVDELGQPIPGITVTADAAGQAGSVSPSSTATDASGDASFEWTLGTGIGVVTVELSAQGVARTVEAEAVAVPETLELVSGDAQTAPAGQAVSSDPTVRVLDQVGLPLPGHSVNFTVESGGGSVQGGGSQTTVQTNAQGRASTSWTLGTDSEAQSLEAASGSLGPVEFTATADLSAPASLDVVSGSGQSAETGETLPQAVVVQLVDLAGDPVSAVAVDWSASGDGSVGSADSQTDAQGRAEAVWTLGSTGGTQSLTATAAGLSATAFAQATTPPSASGFALEYDYQSSIDPDVQAAFESAAARWSEVITGDLPDGQLDLADTHWCTDEEISRVVDDLLVVVIIEAIDGVGGTLGSAGPCLIRQSGLPILGRVRLDEADVQNLLADGTLEDVILHEIGHVLGIGTLWETMGLLQDKAPEPDSELDPWFSGSEAIAGFDAVGGTNYTDGNKVPVENTGGSGTRNAHWRESVLEDELMTGWLSGSTNPMSVVTVGSLSDLGYAVDMGTADPFGFAAMVLGGAPDAGIPLGDDIERGPISVVNPDGTVVRILGR